MLLFSKLLLPDGIISLSEKNRLTSAHSEKQQDHSIKLQYTYIRTARSLSSIIAHARRDVPRDINRISERVITRVPQIMT